MLRFYYILIDDELWKLSYLPLIYNHEFYSIILEEWDTLVFICFFYPFGQLDQKQVIILVSFWFP